MVKLVLVPALVLAAVLLIPSPAPAAGACMRADVVSLCCPTACALRRSSRWSEADGALRACMASVGCAGPRVDQADTSIECGCH